MITSKQRAKLRALANSEDTILQIGKSGIGETLTVQVNDALTARELVKMRVLETAPVLPKEAAIALADALHADVIQVIGTKFVLYRKNSKNPKIILED